MFTSNFAEIAVEHEINRLEDLIKRLRKLKESRPLVKDEEDRIWYNNELLKIRKLAITPEEFHKETGFQK